MFEQRPWSSSSLIMCVSVCSSRNTQLTTLNMTNEIQCMRFRFTDVHQTYQEARLAAAAAHCLKMAYLFLLSPSNS